MTKKELNARSGDKVAELLSNPTFHALLETAREECPFLEDKSPDPTGIIRNEGKIQGWNACLRYLKTIGKVEAAPEKPAPKPLYPDPEKIQSDKNK